MKVQYDGPTGAVNRDVGRATGQGDRLVKGREYDVPADLAERLVRSSMHWRKPAPKPKAPSATTAADKPADKPKEVSGDGS